MQIVNNSSPLNVNNVSALQCCSLGWQCWN